MSDAGPGLTKRSAPLAASASSRAASAFRSRRFRTGPAFRPSACSPFEAATGVDRSGPAARSLRRPDGGEASTRSMPRARRNTRCSPRCWRARPTPSCWSGSPSLRGDATPARRRACRARRRPRAKPRVERVEREYFNLFIGLGRGELLPYGSYYLTGFLHERPLARLRDDLARARHRARRRQCRAGGSRRDPVRDHGGPGRAAACRRRPAPISRLFEKHLAPWIGRFFADLERAEAADFYRRVGTLGRVFMEIETEAFALPS